MPIIACKNGYIYRSEAKPKRKALPIFKVFLTFLFIGIIAFLGIIFSDKIPDLIGINTSNYFNKKSLYAIKIASFDCFDDAYLLSQTIKKQGGAGYVLNSHGTFDVLISCYKEKTDAEKVVNNLKQEGVECECYTFVLNPLSIKFEVNSEQKSVIKKCVNMFFENYCDLYDLSNYYDNKTFSKAEVLTELERIIEKDNQTIKKFGEIKLNDNASLIYLKIYLEELSEKLEKLKLCEENFNAEINYTYFECISLYVNFRQEIQKWQISKWH